MSKENLLFDRDGDGDDDDNNCYDSEDIFNDEDDFDFYETDYDANSDFKNTPDLKVAYDITRGDDGRFLVPPPLPLCQFDKGGPGAAEARTITGRCMRSIDHHPRPSGSIKDSLHNPMICRERMSWFTQREKLEAAKLEEQTPLDDTLPIWSSSNVAVVIHKDDVFQSIPFSRQSVEKRDKDQLEERLRSGKQRLSPHDNTVTREDVEPDRPAAASAPSTPRFNRTPSYTASNPVNHLVFDSDFESGNLSKATRVYGRNKLMQEVSCTCAGNVPFVSAEERNCAARAVDHEYDLQLSCDVHTTGNIQWYYFSASTPPGIGPDASPADHALSARQSSSSSSPLISCSALPREYSDSPSPVAVHPASIRPVTYPLTVRFNIINMMKSDALYNYGMKPAVYSERENDSSDEANRGWKHVGEAVCYFKNSKSYMKKRKDKVSRAKYYTLTFTYTFNGPDTVYFAHCFPYTYTQLQKYLHTLESDLTIARFIRRKLLCYTLANNRCDLLTITTPSTKHAEMMCRPVIVVSARVHPGETNSSYMMEGFLTFLTSQDPAAKLLRDAFVFKVVPMLNPDGVIHGNYRCSLAGVDLNRKYNMPDPVLHPTIFSMKNLLVACQKERGVFLYLDLHGHSQNKNTFLYGCDPLQSDIRRVAEAVSQLARGDLTNYSIFPRIFPKVLVAASNLFTSDKISDTFSQNAKKMNGSEKSSPSSKLKQCPNATEGQFCFKDCSLKVQRSKAGTGRVVSWADVGINAAYTIEISFCGSGNNRERKLIKSYAQQKAKVVAGAGGSEESVSVGEELRGILKTYQTEKHYSQECLRDLGTQLCLAVASYGNLGICSMKDTWRRMRQVPGETEIDDVSEERSDDPGDDDGVVGDEATMDLPLLHEMVMIEELYQPILQPSVMSDEVYAFVMADNSSTTISSFSKDKHKGTENFRIRAELDLRKCIRLQDGVGNSSSSQASPSVQGQESLSEGVKNMKTSSKSINKKTKNKTKVEVQVYNFHLSYTADEGGDLDEGGGQDQDQDQDQDQEGEDVGSDSDPSGDEATPHMLSHSKVFLKMTNLSKNKLEKRKSGKSGKKRRAKLKKREKDKSTDSDNNQGDCNQGVHSVVGGAEKPKGRSSPAPHRVAIAESAMLTSSSTAYNQTISTSARRSSNRSQRQAADPGKRVVPSYHNFFDLQSPRVDAAKTSLRVSGLASFATSPSTSPPAFLLPRHRPSLDLQGSSPPISPPPRHIHRTTTPRSMLRSDSLDPSREDKWEHEQNGDRTTSVLEAVRKYKASIESPPLSPARGAGDVGIASKQSRERPASSCSSSSGSNSMQVPPSSPLLRSRSINGASITPPVFPPAVSPSSSSKSQALLTSSSKKLLIRSSELETLQRLTNMNLGKSS